MADIMDNFKDGVDPWWGYQDEVEYKHIKMRYSDRRALLDEATAKQKAFDSCTPKNPLYHRIAVSAESAKLRVDMAYMVDRMTKLEELLSTVSFLHQRLDILEGSYSYIKMLAEGGRLDYATLTRIVKDIEKLKEEQANAITQRSDRPHGAEG